MVGSFMYSYEYIYGMLCIKSVTFFMLNFGINFIGKGVLFKGSCYQTIVPYTIVVYCF